MIKNKFLMFLIFVWVMARFITASEGVYFLNSLPIEKARTAKFTTADDGSSIWAGGKWIVVYEK
jgi:hypothetical protein